MTSTIQIVRDAIENHPSLPAARKRRLLRKTYRRRVIDAVEEYAIDRAIEEGVIEVVPADLSAGDEPEMTEQEQGRRDWEAFGKFLTESLLPLLVALIELFMRFASTAA